MRRLAFLAVFFTTAPAAAQDTVYTEIGRGPVVEFLKTGRNAHTAAFASMSEVIEHSTRHMVESGLRAMAVYLKSLDSEARPAPARPDDAVMAAGAAIHFDNCSACHVSDGSGVARFFAPLAGSAKAKANDGDATTVVRVILEGARGVTTGARPSPPAMPAYGWKLTDAQVAAVATHVRMSWGNRGGAVTASDVARLRARLAAGLGPDRRDRRPSLLPLLNPKLTAPRHGDGAGKTARFLAGSGRHVRLGKFG